MLSRQTARTGVRGMFSQGDPTFSWPLPLEAFVKHLDMTKLYLPVLPCHTKLTVTPSLASMASAPACVYSTCHFLLGSSCLSSFPNLKLRMQVSWNQCYCLVTRKCQCCRQAWELESLFSLEVDLWREAFPLSVAPGTLTVGLLPPPSKVL